MAGGKIWKVESSDKVVKVKATRKKKTKKSKAFKKKFYDAMNSYLETNYLMSTTYISMDCDQSMDRYLLNGIAQGDNWGERNGDEIKMTNVHIKGAIYQTDTSNAPFYTTVWLVYDRRSNGENFVLTSGVDSFLNSGAITGYCDMENAYMKDRFIVLKRDSWVNNYPVIGAQSGQVTHTFDWNITLNKNKKAGYGATKYNGISASYIDVTKGGLWLITAGNGSTTKSTLIFNYYLGYKDS